MKFYIKVSVIITMFMLVSTTVFADDYYDIPKTKVSYLRAYSTYAVAILAEDATNPNGCTFTHEDKNAGYFVAIQFSETGGKEMYATLLSAFIANRSVSFGISGCFPWGTGGTIPNAYRVQVYTD